MQHFIYIHTSHRHDKSPTLESLSSVLLYPHSVSPDRGRGFVHRTKIAQCGVKQIDQITNAVSSGMIAPLEYGLSV